MSLNAPKSAPERRVAESAALPASPARASGGNRITFQIADQRHRCLLESHAHVLRLFAALEDIEAVGSAPIEIERRLGRVLAFGEGRQNQRLADGHLRR